MLFETKIGTAGSQMPSAQEWIGRLLLADCRARGAVGVAGENHGLVGEGEEALRDGFDQLLVRAAGQVRSAQAASEERVAREERALA